MADADDEAENIDIFQQLFGDSDIQEEFEGFDINDVNQNIEILREIDFDQSLKDTEVREDTPPFCAPFIGTPGLKIQLKDYPKPIDFCNLLFKKEMRTLLTTQTNLYAENRIANEHERQLQIEKNGDR